MNTVINDHARNSCLTRRQVLKAAAATAAISIVPRHVLAGSGQTPPSEQVKVGVIGVHYRGPQLIQVMPSAGRVVAISDCYTQRMDETLAKLGDVKLATYRDYRNMIDMERLDAVVVATRAMQRVLVCIHACQAGLDIYGEKPLSLYVREGAHLIAAVRKHNVIFQHGTQSRSVPINRFICDLVRRGGIGRLKKIVMRNHVGPIPYPGLPEQPIPEGLDWDRWSSQAPLLPYNHDLFNSFSKYRCYDGGQVTNWVHGHDMVQLALDADEAGPVEIWPVSEYDGAPELRPMQMRYDGGTLVSFEREKGRGPDGGAIFQGEKCNVELNFNKYVSNPPDFIKDAPPLMKTPDDRVGLWTAIPHLQNWLDCIKTRSESNAPIEVAHRSTTVCHLLNISRWLNRRLRWDPAKECFIDDEEANSLLDRPRRQGYELPELG
jgi:predicted dehydrogenase